MKKLLANPKIAAALDKPGERMEFFRDLQNAGNGGVTKNNVKEMLGKYMKGKGRAISRKEAAVIAGELFKGEARKYISPKNNPKNINSRMSGMPAANQSAKFSAAQAPPAVPRIVMANGGRISSRLAAIIAGSGKTPRSPKDLPKEDNEGDGGSFSRALAATMRNKRN